MAHYQEDEQSNSRPHQLLLKWCPRLRKRYLRKQGSEGFDKIEESYYHVLIRLCRLTQLAQ